MYWGSTKEEEGQKDEEQKEEEETNQKEKKEIRKKKNKKTQKKEENDEEDGEAKKLEMKEGHRCWRPNEEPVRWSLGLEANTYNICDTRKSKLGSRTKKFR